MGLAKFVNSQQGLGFDVPDSLKIEITGHGLDDGAMGRNVPAVADWLVVPQIVGLVLLLFTIESPAFLLGRFPVGLGQKNSAQTKRKISCHDRKEEAAQDTGVRER